MRPATRLCHSGGGPNGAVVPAVEPSTTFLRDEHYALTGPGYARDESPSVVQTELLLADLEGGADAMLFASGMAACTAPFLLLRPGDHAIAPTTMYWGLRSWLLRQSERAGWALSLVDCPDTTAVAAALRPGQTKVLWLETPANPTLDITDIAACARLAHVAGARVAVDSTVATPILSRPLQLGADLVVHAATKALNGHGDVVAGALVTAKHDDAWDDLRVHRHDVGPVLGAFEAWLLLRGLRTLDLRVRRASGTAMELSRRLQGHGAVHTVLYPGLPTFPGHALAAGQMSGGFGSLLSFCVRGGSAAALAVAGRLRLVQRATSLGGFESLIEHRATIEGPTSPVPADLLRLSVGLEDVDDLWADLEAALGPN